MKRYLTRSAIILTTGLMIFGLSGPAFGQLYRNTREIRDITRQLKNQSDYFQSDLSAQLNRRSSISRQDRDALLTNVSEMRSKISDFETRFDRQYETADDVTAILRPALQVDRFVSYNSISTNVDSNWRALRGLLDRLAANYNVSWNWGQPMPPEDNNYPMVTGTSYSYSLTGTYRFDPARSEDTEEIADRAIRRSGSGDDPANRADLEDKLDAPEQIAIDVRGNQVTIATSNADPVSFTADGRELTQTTDDGRTIRVRASLRGQELTISSLGGESDYTITFVSTENGNSMKVTRRVTTRYLSQTVFAESVYRKTDSIARLGTFDPGTGGYSSNDPNDRTAPNNYPTTYPGPTTVPGRTGDYIVPNDMVLYGTLENDIDTKVSQNNDRFRMTVTSPDQFRGAVVEGYLSGIDRSGRITGRSELTFNFQTIRMPNGRSYDFAGSLQSVTDENGKTIKVDEEGTAKGDSQTKETVKRSGIGAGIGALIGAIAGGAKGAAIGAAIGGGAGAGSVILQGKDDLRLPAGSEISVRSSSPLR